jgi:hypothetical protein
VDDVRMLFSNWCVIKFPISVALAKSHAYCSSMLTIRRSVLGTGLGRPCSTPNVERMPISCTMVYAMTDWYHGVMASPTFLIGIQAGVHPI